MAAMRRLTVGACLLWFVAGCCSQGRFRSAERGPIVNVSRDEQVGAWRVNGRKVCPKVIWAAPGCYVLEVDFSASYKRYREESSGDRAIGIVSPLGRILASEGNAVRSHYSSSNIPFALTLRENATYYLTSTFTGD